MIEAGRYSTNDVRTIYSRRSRVYSKTIAPLEFPNHIKAIERAAIRPGEAVLEVAVGPGLAMVELAKYVVPPNTIQGVDISPGMLAVARQTLETSGVANVELSEGSATELHFPDNTFDVLYNAYMLDLIPLADMLRIVNEFKRVLKPAGRLILLNMSKRDAQITTWRERLYPLLPPKLALYVIGGCRPVLMEQTVKQAGFSTVMREYLEGQFPSEIVTAIK